MLSHFESRVGQLYITELSQDDSTGELGYIETWPLFMPELVDESFHFVSNPCSGAVTPWNTFLSSQEYPVDWKWLKVENLTTTDICEEDWFGDKWSGYPHFPDDNPSTVHRFYGETCDDTKNLEVLKKEFVEMYQSNYWNGVFLETTVNGRGDFTVTPHYSMGRVSGERAIIMPDNKTVYITEDYYTQNFYKFIATTPGDLSAGELFASKITQTGGSDPSKAKLSIEWRSLGTANDNLFTPEVINTYTTEDFFDLASPNKNGTCTQTVDKKYVAFTSGNVVTSNSECIHLKVEVSANSKLSMFASRLETQRYTAWVEGTQEFSKVEGITFDTDRKDRMWISASDVYKGMLDGDPSDSEDWDYCGTNDIQLDENERGCVFRMMLDDEWNVDLMEAEICGEPNGPFNPDNIGYVDGHEALIFCEDTSDRTTNFAWIYDDEKKSTTPFLQGVDGAEFAGGYHYKIRDWHYLILSVQHPYDDYYEKVEGCDPQGNDLKGQTCNASGTADWLVYFKWQDAETSDPSGSGRTDATTTEEPSEERSYKSSALHKVIVIVVTAAIVACLCSGSWICRKCHRVGKVKIGDEYREMTQSMVYKPPNNVAV